MFPLRDSIEHHGPTPITKLVIWLNIGVFLWQLSGGPQAFEAKLTAYAFIPALFFQNPVGEGYRLISSMFMHGGLFHIIGNLWFLWVFGPALESRLGTVRYALLYLVAGIAGSIAQGLTMIDSTVPMVGASGAISGVLGGYLVRFPKAWVLTMVWFILPFLFWIPAATYIGYWALFQLIYGLFGLPGVGWWAHLGGFAVGLGLVLLLTRRPQYRAEPYYQRWFEFD